MDKGIQKRKKRHVEKEERRYKKREVDKEKIETVTQTNRKTEKRHAERFRLRDTTKREIIFMMSQKREEKDRDKRRKTN